MKRAVVLFMAMLACFDAVPVQAFPAPREHVCSVRVCGSAAACCCECCCAHHTGSSRAGDGRCVMDCGACSGPARTAVVAPAIALYEVPAVQTLIARVVVTTAPGSTRPVRVYANLREPDPPPRLPVG